MAGDRAKRQPILEAMIHVAGRKGYRATTVADVIAEAGASRTTFYKHFADKHGCFLTAYELVAERCVAAVEAGCGEGRSWLQRARGSLVSLVELFTAEPDLARVAMLEVAMAGAKARDRQLAGFSRIAQLLEARDDRNGPRLPAGTAPMTVGAVAGLLSAEIRAGRIATLRKRLPDLLFALLVPYVGPRRATEEALRGRVAAID